MSRDNILGGSCLTQETDGHPLISAKGILMSLWLLGYFRGGDFGPNSGSCLTQATSLHPLLSAKGSLMSLWLLGYFRGGDFGPNICTALFCTYCTMPTCVYAPAGAAGIMFVRFCDQVMMSPCRCIWQCCRSSMRR
jgi:hypothetical protein